MIALALICLAVVATAGTPLAPSMIAITGLMIGLLQLVTLACSARAGFGRRLPPRLRRPWRFFAAASAVLLVQGVLINGFPQNSQLLTVGAALRGVFSALVLCAVFSFPSGRRTRTERAILSFDMLMPSGAASLVVWYYLIGPALTRGLDPVRLLTAVASPLLSLVLVCGAFLVVARGIADAFRRPILLLLAGSGLLMYPDLTIAYVVSHDLELVPAHSADAPQIVVAALVGASLVGGFGLQTLAALQSWAAVPPEVLARADGRTGEPARSRTGSEDGSWRAGLIATYLPYAAVVLGYAFLLGIAARSGLYPWGGLMAGTVIMTSGLVVRQFLHHLESRRLATTDSLTGLVNRRSFTLGLARRLDRSSRTSQGMALLLFDLNDFKAINDTLGHAAGDVALREFAHVLSRNVLGREIVARLGGDEFAIVLDAISEPGQAVVVAERILADLGEPVTLPGERRVLRTSVGIALSAPGQEVATPDELLDRADLAMYDAKRTRSGSWTVYTDALAREKETPQDGLGGRSAAPARQRGGNGAPAPEEDGGQAVTGAASPGSGWAR